jgi:hypothetical protein
VAAIHSMIGSACAQTTQPVYLPALLKLGWEPFAAVDAGPQRGLKSNLPMVSSRIFLKKTRSIADCLLIGNEWQTAICDVLEVEG